MFFRRLLATSTLVACTAFSISGCAGYVDDGGETQGNRAPMYDDAEVEPDYEDLADEQLAAAEQSQPWVCSYAPSYDDDWHNDVVCTNGVETETPYLREGDTFITQDEIMESAQEYEDQLNAAG